MSSRKKITDSVQFEVVFKSARRCCMCFALDADFTEKAGQIAHLDHDRTNDVLSNLAWLCLPHHDAYDGRTSQSKGYSITEVRRYRDQLHIEVERWRRAKSHEESDELFQYKQNLIEENLSLFFFAALGSEVPSLRSVLIEDLSDNDFKLQLTDAWAFLDRPEEEDKGLSRKESMARYIGTTEEGKEDLTTLLGLASTAINVMTEEQRNNALFSLHSDTFRSALLLLHKLRNEQIKDQG